MKYKIIFLLLILIGLSIIVLRANNNFILKGKISYAYYKEITKESSNEVKIHFTTFDALKKSNFRNQSLQLYFIFDKKLKDKLDVNNIKLNGEYLNDKNINCKKNGIYCMVKINNNILKENNLIKLSSNIYKIKENSFIGLTLSNQ